MNENLLPLINKYKKLGVIIDTNIFLLYLVGSVTPTAIRNYKRTSMFSNSDFKIVAKFIDLFEVKVTTPHILTEVSNLLKQDYYRKFLQVYLGNLLEIYTPSTEVVKNALFEVFDLADIAILKEAKNKFLVLTDDGKLGNYLRNSNIDVITIDDMRASVYN